MFGQHLENTLDAKKFLFLERCIATIKKLGVPVEASGGFSVYVGKGGGRELFLDEYWDLYAESQEETVFDRIASAVRHLAGG